MSLTEKEQIDVLKIALESRQKELEGRITLMTTISTTGAIAGASLVFAFKERIHPTLGVGLTIIVFALAASVMLWIYTQAEEAGRSVAVVEDGINQVAGRKFLTYETTLAVERYMNSWKNGPLVFAICVTYVLVQAVFTWTFREQMFAN